MAAGRLDVLLSLDAAEFTSGLTRAEYESKKFQESMLRMGKAAGALFGTAVIAGAVAFGKAIYDITSELDDLDESAQALQTTAVALAEMRTAATQAGVEVGALDTALTRLNVKITEAAGGGKEAASLFEAMGVAVKDAAGQTRGTEQVLADVADQFSKLQEGPAKAALAVQLFGKAGAQMIPYLNQGAEGMRKFSGLTDETVKSAARLQNEIDKLSQSWQQFKYAIAEVALPALNDIIERFRQVDFGKAFESLKSGNIAGFFRSIEADAQRAADKQKQLRDALTLGAEAYSNEGRSALRSADDLLERAKALEASKEAAKRAAAAADAHAKALEREAAARQGRYLRDFASARTEAMGEDTSSFDKEQAKELAAELDRQEKYLRDYARARSEAFGEEFVQETKKASDAAQQFGLVMNSALGELFDPNTRFNAKSFFDALIADILRLTTQLLILKPLMEGINATWGDTPASSSGGQQMAGIFGAAKDWFSSIASSFVGSFASGTDFVAADGLAMVHRGERIVTAEDNRRGSSGATFHITNQWPAGTTTETASQAGAAFARKLNTWNTRNN